MRLKKNRDYNTTDYGPLKISDLKTMADYWLRKYLLSKANRQGNKIFCPIKNRYYPEDKIQVAHFYDRNINCLRYSLDNCNLISAQSNMWDAQIPDREFKSKHHKEYYQYLAREKGDKFLANLLQESQSICIFTRSDYVNIIEKFRNG